VLGRVDGEQQVALVRRSPRPVAHHDDALRAALPAGHGQDHGHVVGVGRALQAAEHVDVDVLGRLLVAALRAADDAAFADDEVGPVALLAEVVDLGDGGGVVGGRSGDGIHLVFLTLGGHRPALPGRHRSWTWGGLHRAPSVSHTRTMLRRIALLAFFVTAAAGCTD